MRAQHLDPVFTWLRAAWLARPALAMLWLAAGLLGAAGAALAATPLGSEFQINPYWTGYQQHPSVAVDADGDFVIVWAGYAMGGVDSYSWSIQGQRYDASGNALGSEFQVNTYTTGNQWYPSVAVDADGDFVVVWQSDGSAGSDSSRRSIQGQRYDASGNPVGSEFQVNTYTSGDQLRPAVAVDADGDFVVVWMGSLEIQGQRYDASGNPVGSEFQVNTYTNGSQARPSVAVDATGGSVVVWGSDFNAGSDPYKSIQAQRYDASGNALGSEFQVNTYTTGYQYFASVSTDADGDFVVVWTSREGGDPPTSVQGQRYDASGNALGGEFQVNTYNTGRQLSPEVAVDADGDFVVVWTSDGSAGSDTSDRSIQGQHFDASGNAVGSEFQVNTYTTDSQSSPSVAIDADGKFVVVWTSSETPGGDPHRSIQGQRYTVEAPPVPSLAPPGALGLALLLFGVAAAALRGRLLGRA